MFTSCCPAWVRFLENNYPELKSIFPLQRARSRSAARFLKPMAHSWTAKRGKDIYSVSVMPCTCKEFECERPEMKDSGYQDVDVAITRDLAWLIKDAGIDWNSLEEMEFDKPLGFTPEPERYSGVTGGVMEAAIRTGYELITKEAIPDVEVTAVRGTEGFRTSVLKVGRPQSQGWCGNRA